MERHYSNGRTSRRKFKIPAKLTNDANAAAVGEMQYGVAKGMKNFITITLGTGVVVWNYH
jgi:predicted NBD/HSP70 family sugar kinase